MALLQKITRPRVRILGTEYSARVVGLHNRLRAHAHRLLVYKDIRRLARAADPLTRGVFVPGRRRLVIYLRSGAPEITVAHEIVHALLYTEGFLPLRCRKDDLRDYPEIGEVAQSLNDLLVHPVLFDRLRRAGYDAGDGRIPRGAQALPDAHRAGSADACIQPPHGDRRAAAAESPADASLEARALATLARAVRAAQTLLRFGPARAAVVKGDIDHVERGAWDVAVAASSAAPWDPRRSPLDARVRAARLVSLLEDAARDRFGISLGLKERILMPAPLTRRRLAAAAARIFDVRTAVTDARVVLVAFLPDASVCSARVYADAERAGRVAAAVRREMQEMNAAAFVERHRLEYLLIAGGRRYQPRTGGVAVPGAP